MSINSQDYDVIFGQLLSKGVALEKAKSFALVLLNLSQETGVHYSQLVKNITKDGIKFDQDFYDHLNAIRTSSSQLGYLEFNETSNLIAQQEVRYSGLVDGIPS